MSEVPNLIDYWAAKSSCQAISVETSLTEEHIIHNDCMDDAIIEHYGLQFWDHNWPGEVDGEPTYELMWNFLSQFSKSTSAVCSKFGPSTCASTLPSDSRSSKSGYRPVEVRDDVLG